ncbi:MAG: UDP-4-amino-4-deoxy-L-arabinose aminotransferase [Deltaproteobacteria bacterium]|nr:UDP-4-amino-4-deoxy-L-arabinose aminotransferase [Deltaproteobacteria bacterium]
MKNKFLPFSKPSISDADIETVCDVMRSGWLTTGKQAALFEKQFCKYTGAAHCVALCSATAGMHLLLSALGIGPGDEVLTPSMTWVSTVNLITLAGATPVFADIDRDTLMVTPETIEKCVTEKTRLIIPVHFAGAPADIGPIRDMAATHGIFLAEDAAHALGTKYKGDKIGAAGTCIFSFHPIKNITTGEGGMFCTDNAGLADSIRRLKFHGLGADAYDRATGGRSPTAEVLEPGFKYNLTDMAAALGISQLNRIDDFNGKRKALAARYRKQLAKLDAVTPLFDPPYDYGHAWHLFVIRLDIDKANMSVDDFIDEMKTRNIGVGRHFKAVHLHKFYRETLRLDPENLKNTEWNSMRICSLPLFPDMEPEDVDRVVNAIKEILTK